MHSIKVETTQMPEVIAKLKQYGTQTYKIVAALRLCVNGIRTGICHTDTWPNFTTVFLQLTEPHMLSDRNHLFSTDKRRAHDLLVDCLPEMRGDGIIFGDVQHFMTDELKDLYESQGYNVVVSGPQHILEAEQNETLPASPEVQKGYKISVLSPEHVNLVKSNWFQQFNYHEFLNYVIKNQVTVSMETEGGELIGWIMEYTYGAQGILHVMESHRHKGLGKTILCHHRDMLLKDGKPAYMYVHTKNEASLGLAKSCGYRIVKDEPDHGHFWVSVRKI